MSKFTIDKARSRDDFDNFCFQPSDGGQYDPINAIHILQNGCGGSMQNVKTGKGYIVNYDKSKNDWLVKELKLK